MLGSSSTLVSFVLIRVRGVIPLEIGLGSLSLPPVRLAYRLPALRTLAGLPGLAGHTMGG